MRGLEGPRAQVLGDGDSTLDVSTTSVDHALSIDPFLTDQIEVLKGPATSLYGSGAIGGAVNVREGRIPDRQLEGIDGRVEPCADSVNDGRAAAGRIDAGNGTLAVHAVWSHRSGDAHEGTDGAEIENTQSVSDRRAVGFSITGDRGHAGLSLSAFDNTSGIPPEEEGAEGEAAGSGASKTPSARFGAVDGEGNIELDTDQRRLDVDARLLEPLAGWERVDVRIGHNDYEHAAMSLDEGGEIGTQFFDDVVEGHIEAVQAPIGAWRGAVGVQSSRRAFEALGDEASVPPSLTRDFGRFLVERASFEPFAVEFGARLDRQSVEPDTGDRVKHNPYSVSAAGRWGFTGHWHASLNLDRAPRAPQAE